MELSVDTKGDRNAELRRFIFVMLLGGAITPLIWDMAKHIAGLLEPFVIRWLTPRTPDREDSPGAKLTLNNE